MLAALTAFNGWSMVAMLGGEVQEPARNLPWAIIRGVGIAMLLYAAANFAYLHVLSMHEIVTANSTAHPNATSVASRAVTMTLGSRIGVVLPIVLALSALGAMHVALLGVPRVLFAMARDSLLPRSVSRLTASAHTPAVAIMVYATIGSVLAVLGGFDRLANMAGFGYLAFYALNIIGLLRARYRSAISGDPATLRVPIWIPVLFLLATLWLLVTLVARGSIENLAALLLIGLGLPVFAIMKRRRES
jgi:APA family basic amino acid/polyamine antiporter